MYVIPPRAGVARASERLFRRLLDASPSHSGLLRDVSVSLNNVGRVELARGNLDGASAAYAVSLSVLTGLQRDGKLLPEWRNDIAWVKDRLGRLGSETRAPNTVDIPQAHPAADANRAAALNIDY